MTRISHAPASVNLSMATAICLRCTMTLMATQPLSSSEVTVGARLPGVICLAMSSLERSMLYVQRTYFWAAKTVVSGGSLERGAFERGCSDEGGKGRTH